MQASSRCNKIVRNVNLSYSRPTDEWLDVIHALDLPQDVITRIISKALDNVECCIAGQPWDQWPSSCFSRVHEVHHNLCCGVVNRIVIDACFDNSYRCYYTGVPSTYVDQYSDQDVDEISSWFPVHKIVLNFTGLFYGQVQM